MRSAEDTFTKLPELLSCEDTPLLKHANSVYAKPNSPSTTRRCSPVLKATRLDCAKAIWSKLLRGEAFNALNWVNPNGFSSTNNTSTTFGVISSYRAARRVQVALKLNF
jgi:hypothetical protein